MARIGPIDRKIGADGRQAVPDHDHAFREDQRFLDVMGHEERGEALLLPEVQDLRLHGEAGQGVVELAEGLVEQEEPWLVDERTGERRALGHAAGELVRIRGHP